MTLDPTIRHSGIENCKPGIWKAIAKETPDELKSSGIILECCLQWVADLDETTSLDLASSVKTWKEWDQKLREKFGEDGVAEPLSKAIVWKEAESYFDDGGLCNVITAEYVTEKGFRKLVHGGKGGDSEDEEDEEDDDEEEEEEEEEDDEDLGSYLEPITLKDWELDVAENDVFTLGGLHCESNHHPSCFLLWSPLKQNVDVANYLILIVCKYQLPRTLWAARPASQPANWTARLLLSSYSAKMRSTSRATNTMRSRAMSTSSAAHAVPHVGH